jgi:hypothetical protein
MNKRRPPATEEELVHAFADLFDEVEPETPEEVDAVLREVGHDPDTIAARMKSIAERALARSPLNRAQQELEAERSKLESAVHTPRPGTRQEAARPPRHGRLVHWLSPLWHPPLAGEPVTAAEAPTQAHTFYLDEGVIQVTCTWWAAAPGQPAALRIAWHADLTLAGDFWARFTRPDDATVVLAEVPLGSALAGEEVFSMQELGFDPTREPWALTLVLREPEP